ncbi:MAG: T9SS type A sorting domain-containing protein [Bacteroidota bacterium]
MKKLNTFLCAMLFAVAGFAQDSVDITFHVNMINENPIDAANIYVAGGAEFGVPGDNPMSDPDNDSTFTVTIRKPKGVSSFYTFINGPNGWADKENLSGKPCGDPFNFNDRWLPAVNTDTTLLHCFAECTTDGTCPGPVTDSVDITIHVNMSNEDPIDAANIYVAGGSGFGVPGDNQMMDLDNDSTFTIVLRRAKGFASFYTFINGPNSWGDKENLSGKPCGDPANFNDRWLPPVNTDTTLMHCFGECITDGSCPGPVSDSVDITIMVNMINEDPIDAANIYVAGGSGFGVPGDNPMADPDNDSVFTIILRRAKGFASFYTFINGPNSWGDKENLAGKPCGNPANFNDRWLPPVNTDTTLMHCFGECTTDGSCPGVSGDSVDITFTVNLKNEMLDPANVFIAGGGNFGIPGDYPMADPDGDSVYTITVRQPEGFASFYTFINGPNSWNDKENLSGKPCGDPDNFNDRWLPPVFSDTTLHHCFGECTTDGSCPSPPVPANLTLQVNMKGLTFHPDSVQFQANFLNWAFMSMTDADGDSLFTATVQVDPGGYEYLFANGSSIEDLDSLVGQSCVMDFGGGFVNRVITVEGDTVVCFDYGRCETCMPVVVEDAMVTLSVDMSNITVDAAGMMYASNFNNWTATPMTDDDNDNIWEVTVMLAPGTYEYLFINGAAWEAMDPATSDSTCTLTTGAYTNRVLTVNGDTSACHVFEECTECKTVGINEVVQDLIRVRPTRINGGSFQIDFVNAQTASYQLEVMDLMGRQVLREQVAGSTQTHRVSTASWSKGIYLVKTSTKTQQQTVKVLVE